MSREPMHQRIFTADLGNEVYLQEVTDESGAVLLELTADTGDEETTVRLDPFHARELRLALSTYERRRKSS